VKTAEVWADEKAKEMLNTWRTDDEGRYKEQIRSLQESHAHHTTRIEKLQKELAEEKTKCAGLEKDASHKTQLHKLEVDNLDKRLKLLKGVRSSSRRHFFHDCHQWHCPGVVK
jgi:predicted RNase H-like nuclease (RuvC/YqgF family)